MLAKFYIASLFLHIAAGQIIDVTKPGYPLVDGPGPHKRIRYTGLQQSKPYVIGHRGDSGEFPEHSSLSYLAAINHGTDFIECCDVVLTKDLVPICRHEPNLSNTTNADDVFPHKIRNYTIDGFLSTGVHAIDLTLAEVKQLYVRERLYFRSQVYNDRYPVLTFEECAMLAKSAPRVVGIYPETKHPTWHDGLLKSRGQFATITDRVLAVVKKLGYDNSINTPAWLAQPIFLQSFEVSNLKYAYTVSKVPIVQLTEDLSMPLPDGSFANYSQILNTDAGMAEVSSYANAIGPLKTTLLKVENRTTALAVTSGVVERAHKFKMQVHLWVFRNEVDEGFPYPFTSVSEEYTFYMQTLSVDGAFTDFPGTFVPWRNNFTSYDWATSIMQLPDQRPAAFPDHAAAPQHDTTSKKRYICGYFAVKWTKDFRILLPQCPGSTQFTCRPVGGASTDFLGTFVPWRSNFTSYAWAPIIQLPDQRSAAFPADAAVSQHDTTLKESA